MEREQIKSLGDADIFFVQQGAVGFFDSLFPKNKYEDQAQIFKRHYFTEGHKHLGYYIPSFEGLGSFHSVKSYSSIQDYWTNHPNLVKLQQALRKA